MRKIKRKELNTHKPTIIGPFCVSVIRMNRKLLEIIILIEHNTPSFMYLFSLYTNLSPHLIKQSKGNNYFLRGDAPKKQLTLRALTNFKKSRLQNANCKKVSLLLTIPIIRSRDGKLCSIKRMLG